jgi:hypothetical protein
MICLLSKCLSRFFPNISRRCQTIWKRVLRSIQFWDFEWQGSKLSLYKTLHYCDDELFIIFFGKKVNLVKKSDQFNFPIFTMERIFHLKFFNILNCNHLQIDVSRLGCKMNLLAQTRQKKETNKMANFCN